MNKKGFTLVELIATFSLAAIVFIVLINILVIIKDIYTSSDTKTQLLINQANLSNAINSKLVNGTLLGYSECTDSDFCYVFTLNDGTSIKLIVTDTKIKFGDYVYKLMANTKITDTKITNYNNFLNIKISITNEVYPGEDYGVNVVYLGSVTET